MDKIYSSRILLVSGLIFLLCAHFNIVITLGDMWYYIHSNSLVGLQRLVGEKLDPDPTNPSIYFKIILPILQTNLMYVVAFTLFLFAIKNILFRKNKKNSKKPILKGRF